MSDYAEHFDRLDIDTLCVNTIRTLAIDAIQKANSGHPGAPMGCASMAYTLWARHLRHDPGHPDWFDRDRFVLSNGHASMLLYALLHLSGYDLSLDDLKNFRQWDSRTPGHPENHLTPGVEITTGPLGQGISSAVGFALAEANLAANYNKDGHQVIDHYTYAIAGDGCLMEGVSAEAASLAGHLGLGKLIVLYDDNQITIDGPTGIAFTEDVERRFKAYGWHTLVINDGNDLAAIDAALEEARGASDRPSLLLIKTHIGYGSPNLQDTSKVHGSPLGAEEIKRTKAAYGWPEDAQFVVPERATKHMRGAIAARSPFADWQQRFEAYAKAHPKAAAELTRRIAGDLPEGWRSALPVFPTDANGLATRASSHKVIQALHTVLPEMLGGSADLAASNKTHAAGYGVLSAEDMSGRNIAFGVREHGMGAICNGLALHGGVLPFGATFLVFSDYMRGAVRLGALEQAKAIWVFTHDSIGVGEDGPTHQPVEHFAALRAIPDLLFVRPADANEVAEAWAMAVEAKAPVALALTRQNLPTLDRERFAPAAGLQKGAYTLMDCQGTPEMILMASGSEVHVALEAAAALKADGAKVRVVSFPCWEAFEAQPEAYREEVLPKAVTKRVAIEAGISMGWYRYLGFEGKMIGLDRYGASAPAGTLFEQFGLTAANVTKEAKALLEG